MLNSSGTATVGGKLAVSAATGGRYRGAAAANHCRSGPTATHFQS